MKRVCESVSVVFLILFCMSCSEKIASNNEEINHNQFNQCDTSHVICCNNIQLIGDVGSSSVDSSMINNFVFGKQYLYDILFPGVTDWYYSRKSYVLIDNPNDTNSFLAMKIDKEYGIDNYVYFDYVINNDKASIIIKDQYQNQLYEAILDVTNGQFITNRIDCSTRGKSICEKFFLYSGIIYNVSCNTKNLIVVLISTLAFSIIEEMICDSDKREIICPCCGSNRWDFDDDNGVLSCQICGCKINLVKN